MEKQARHLPLSFGNGKIARNRVVVPPMASQTADEAGNVTVATLAHYQRLAESGAGLIFAEYSYVDVSGKSEPRQLGADSDLAIPALGQLAQAMKSQGALAGWQLVHGGGKSSSSLTGQALMAPSAIAVPAKGQSLETPTAMTEAQILSWQKWFLASAHRAARARFDLVELHSAHGYGLNQWLSPLTNQRTDEYGGSIVGRSRMLREIVVAIRQALPELLLAVRLPGQDHMFGGLSLTETNWLAHELESLGVDLLDVSSGIGGWRRPDQRPAEGYLVEDAAQLRSGIRIPVIGVGGISRGEYIDKILREGKVDLAAVGRAILADPIAWKKENLSPLPTHCFCA